MDLDKLNALLSLLKEHDVSEFAYKDAEYSVRLRLGQPVVTMAHAVPHHLAPAPAAAAPAAAPAGESGLTVVESPMVGTFYAAPVPGAEPFVEVGSRVAGPDAVHRRGDEADERDRAEVSGTVVEVLVENGQPVQFGQPSSRSGRLTRVPRRSSSRTAARSRCG
jgi:acetyl-CoA carboxylase biotin carboxyl carrier protein